MANRDRFKEYAREKAQRRLEGLRKSLKDNKWDPTSQYAVEQRIKQLENAIYESRTYADGKRIAGHTQESTRAAAMILERLANSTPIQRELKKEKTFEMPSDYQRNQMFTKFMDIASVSKSVTTTIGKKTFEMTDTMVRMFYRAYQPLWNVGNVPPSERNEIILQKTGFRTLEEAFAVAMGTGNNYERALMLDKMRNGMELSDQEAIELYSMLGESDTFVRYKSGDIAANTEQLAIRSYSGNYQFDMTDEQIEDALRNFLGEDFSWYDLYDEV